MRIRWLGQDSYVIILEKYLYIGGLYQFKTIRVFFDFSLTVKASLHECVIRTGLPET